MSNDVNNNIDCIEIQGRTYVPLDSIKEQKSTSHGYTNFVCIRTYSAGVHCGYLESQNGKEVVLRDAIRIWYWDGAFTLSDLALNGVAKPDNCRFGVPLDKITLTEAIEIIPCTEKARKSIQSVKPESKHNDED